MAKLTLISLPLASAAERILSHIAFPAETRKRGVYIYSIPVVGLHARCNGGQSSGGQSHARDGVDAEA